MADKLKPKTCFSCEQMCYLYGFAYTLSPVMVIKYQVVKPAGGVDGEGNVNKGWVDPATNKEDYTFKSRVDGRLHKLVMSDEFETEGRLFKVGFYKLFRRVEHQYAYIQM